MSAILTQREVKKPPLQHTDATLDTHCMSIVFFITLHTHTHTKDSEYWHATVHPRNEGWNENIKYIEPSFKHRGRLM